MTSSLKKIHFLKTKVNGVHIAHDSYISSMDLFGFVVFIMLLDFSII